jgi:hypothetical protein
MGTKQLRLNDPAQIQKRLPEFIGSTLTLVSGDGTSTVGILQKIEGTKIILKNMRLKNVSFAFDNIVEIYFDTLV